MEKKQIPDFNDISVFLVAVIDYILFSYAYDIFSRFFMFFLYILTRETILVRQPLPDLNPDPCQFKTRFGSGPNIATTIRLTILLTLVMMGGK